MNNITREDIILEIAHEQWNSTLDHEAAKEATHALESGKILLFPKLPFTLAADEIPLLSPTHTKKNRKNISLNSKTGMLQGDATSDHHRLALKNMMQRFAKSATELVTQVLPHYRSSLQIGRTSFRPVEIAGRVSSYRKDDTRLHVDAFPASPNQGRRILRVFTNINPHGQAREWRVGEPFATVAKQFLPRVRKPFPASRALLKLLHITKTYRTRYDHIMLQIHDSMKADVHYQKQAKQCTINFMPGNTWIVQTDHVSHAAMAGQYLLEQTFYLPVTAMLDPNQSPLQTLEKLTDQSLIDHSIFA